MGSQQGKSVDNRPQSQSIVGFLKQRHSHNSSISTETSVMSVQKRWQMQFLQTLDELEKQSKWKDMSQDTRQILKSLNQNNFTKAANALSKISKLDLRQFQSVKNNKSTNNSDLQVSKFVTIEDNHSNILQKSENSPTKVLNKKSIQTVRKQVGYVIRKQLNQSYHPINEIKQSFMMMFQMKFRSMLDDKPCKDQKQKYQIEEKMFQDIDFFCQLTVKGCLIYKPWVMKQTGVKQSKYVTFAKKMAVQSLFSKHSMHQKIFPFLLQFNSKYIENISQKIPQFIKVQNFHILPQLQIQGHFIGSLMLFSQIDSFMSPRKTLQQLNKIKANICSDIENYHETFKTGQSYTIDGDNLLSIICFMLCKLKMKLLPIYCQMQLLFVAYGDNLASVFEEASYMVSTITAAFQYLSGDSFKPCEI